MTGDFHEKLACKRKKRRQQRLFAGILMLVGIFLAAGIFLKCEYVQKKYMYPYPHQEIIRQYAEKYQVEAPLVAGVIMSESKFQNEVHSHRGAIGLMQLMPETAEWISEQLEISYDKEKLHEPEMNIRLGTWYLASLKQEFKGNEVLMLAAYNAGRGNVRSWMEEYGWDTSFTDIREIPFAETREYVQNVLKNKEHYKLLYGQ